MKIQTRNNPVVREVQKTPWIRLKHKFLGNRTMPKRQQTQRVVSVFDWRPPPSHTFIIFVDLKGVIGNSTGWIPDISQNAPTLENANELHDFQKSYKF